MTNWRTRNRVDEIEEKFNRGRTRVSGNGKKLNAGRKRETKGVGKKEGMKGEGAVRINTR